MTNVILGYGAILVVLGIGGYLGSGLTGQNVGHAMFFTNCGTCHDRTHGYC